MLVNRPAASFIESDVDEYIRHPEKPPTQIEQYLEFDAETARVIDAQLTIVPQAQVTTENNAENQASLTRLLADNGSFFNGAVGGFQQSMTDKAQKKSFDEISLRSIAPIDSVVEKIDQTSAVEPVNDQSTATEAGDIFADHLRQAHFKKE